jgi:hypothetical protein
MNDDADLLEAAQMYASHYALQVSELLGSGIHGIVCVLESNTDPGRRALKVHRDSDAYQREKIVYLRLRANRVDRILGFNVPVLLRFDDAFMAIEMTIVTPPFVLDFAGAYLDSPPEFSDQIWADWEAEKREQFGSLWDNVSAVLSELKLLGIYILDPSPSNIRFH